MSILNDGTLYVGNNTDTQSILGRTAIGFVTGLSDYAYVGHLDVADSGGYALVQSAAGATFLNAEDGQDLSFSIHGTRKMVLDDSGNLGVSRTDPSSPLDVKLTETNGSLHNNSTAAVHFGSQGNTDGSIQGISLGYKTDGANTYAKTAIVARGLGDGAARQSLAFLVDTAADGGSAEIGDAKLLIDGTTGTVTMAAQPRFDAGRNAGYVTDDQDFIQDQVRTNIGSHYDNSNGRFTAPVAGDYLFSFRIFTHDSGSVVQAEVTLKKNGSDAFIARAHKVGGYHTPVQLTKVLTLAANDYVNTYVGDSGTSSGWMGSAGEYNYFSGFLIG